LNPIVQQLIGEIWELAKPVIAAALALYLVKAYRQWCKFLGAQENESALRQLDKVAELAMHGAEELARAYGGALTGSQKQDHAVKLVREIAPDDLKAFSDTQVRAALDAKVAEQRAKVTSSAPPPAA
jgi:hypothetical protein